MTQNRPGFTIVDVLAAAAIVSVAGAAAQPVFNVNRGAGFNAANEANHRELAVRQHVFMLDNDNQFAGPNVTGWPGMQGVPIDGGRFVGNTSATTPVEQHDFISPLFGDDLGFSPNRALRFMQLLERFRDPAQRRFNDEFFFGDDTPDLADFEAILDIGGRFRATSYLSPATFHYWGTPRGGFDPDKGGVVPSDEDAWQQEFGGVPYNWGGPIATQIETPRDYRPRLDNVGTSLADKALLADGSRFLEPDTGIVDIQVDPAPRLLGNFTHGFLSAETESSYGRLRGDGSNVRLSARRIGGKTLGDAVMYVTFFDGSTRAVRVGDAKARPDWWAPTGSEWVGLQDIAPEAASQYEVGDRLP
ncbi:MAG: hypothetical protein AAGF47_10195 [Planctomycetota bacterium]